MLWSENYVFIPEINKRSFQFDLKLKGKDTHTDSIDTCMIFPMQVTEGKNQALVGAIQYCGEYPGPRFEEKFRSANQMDGISKAVEIKWLPVNTV